MPIRWTGRPSTWRPKRAIWNRGACLGGRRFQTRGRCLGYGSACRGSWCPCLVGRPIPESSRMPGELKSMPRRSTRSNTPRMPGVLARMPRELARMPRELARSRTRPMPRELARMPRRSAGSCPRPMPGVRARMPRRSALGRDRAACPAQPGVPADRFARKIIGILAAAPGALAAPEHQPVRRQPSTPLTSFKVIRVSSDTNCCGGCCPFRLPPP